MGFSVFVSSWLNVFLTHFFFLLIWGLTHFYMLIFIFPLILLKYTICWEVCVRATANLSYKAGDISFASPLPRWVYFFPHHEGFSSETLPTLHVSVVSLLSYPQTAPYLPLWTCSVLWFSKHHSPLSLTTYFLNFSRTICLAGQRATSYVPLAWLNGLLS